MGSVLRKCGRYLHTTTTLYSVKKMADSSCRTASNAFRGNMSADITFVGFFFFVHNHIEIITVVLALIVGMNA